MRDGGRRCRRAGRSDHGNEGCDEKSEDESGHESSFREGFDGFDGGRQVF
jgi:hypothetical protein